MILSLYPSTRATLKVALFFAKSKLDKFFNKSKKTLDKGFGFCYAIHKRRKWIANLTNVA